MRLDRTMRLMILASVILVGCPEDPTPSDGDGVDLDDLDVFDPSDGDIDAQVDQGPQCPPESGQFSAPCDGDDDCVSGICMLEGASGICTRLCLGACESLCDGRPTYCRGISTEDDDVTFVCRPMATNICSPCTSDGQCEGGRCLEREDASMACGLDCYGPGDCPDGYSCGGADPEHDGQCVPRSGTCTCTIEQDDQVQFCEIENEYGVCPGTQTCHPYLGWTACEGRPEGPASAEVCNGFDDDCDGNVDNVEEIGEACQNVSSSQLLCGDEPCTCPGVQICQVPPGAMSCLGSIPTAEVCDRLDNDCDGSTDEDFVDLTGRYIAFGHCGFCGNSCEDRFEHAAEVVCDQERTPPACVITRCESGLELSGETACVPYQPTFCIPCTDDIQCSMSSPGAACVTIVDIADPTNVSSVCGRDCSSGSIFGTTCPEGFTCQAFTGTGGASIHQCAPVSGTCTCVNNPTGFTVPCRITIEDGEINLEGDRGEVTCSGMRTCGDGEFGACTLYEETCDELDNDCSGRIDDSYRNDDGQYVTDEHCGSCSNNCTTKAYPNATAECRLVDGEPRCVMVCIDDPGGSGVFRDLFNGTDDGCECEVTGTSDVPDGIDSNCDRVDGDASRALFVSKIGSPMGTGTMYDPLDSIQEAISLASSLPDIRDIYVATGVYSENLVLVAGINLYGGYSLDFTRRNPTSNPTAIFGVSPDPARQEIGTITARSINSTLHPTTLSGFSIYGFDAVGSSNSSYAVYLKDCTRALVLDGNRIFAANGANGVLGAKANPGYSGLDGSDGLAGVSLGRRECLYFPNTPGGVGGAGSCSNRGGNGGFAHCPMAIVANGSSCSVPYYDVCLNDCSRDPDDPLPPGQGPGQYGLPYVPSCSGSLCGRGGTSTYDFWSDLGTCFACSLQTCLPHLGMDGQNGRPGVNGTGGGGCLLSAQHGTVNSQGLWVSGAGSNGANNSSHGGGGGGGSAGAGFDVVPDAETDPDCTDTMGGSGGGGGGGGCRGTSGQGGSGGGSSFGVFMYYSDNRAASQPVLTNNLFSQGNGGVGGNGGAGGTGGRGGWGGEGGFSYPSQAFCSSPGGAGGNGGNGGAGGGGGGGCGGNVYSIFLYANGNPFQASVYEPGASGNTFLDDGQAGPGGLGGASTALPSYGGDGYTAPGTYRVFLVP